MGQGKENAEESTNKEKVWFRIGWLAGLCPSEVWGERPLVGFAVHAYCLVTA